ncbi:MAG TPA: uracil-DNA glycosylase family protein [Rhodanobacteraceae bacterium]|nr:uracil-DNA glycosylase family protein [Rhodanobacteraceae bacterium]
MPDTVETVLADIRACRLCEHSLPLGPRPVLQASASSRLLIVSQAPGRRVHLSGVPFDDPSGARLRDWLGIDELTFHDPARVAIVPMAFCYPGKGASGDLPPPRICARTWHPRLLPLLPNVRLTLLVGWYAQAHILGARAGPNLTTTCEAWRQHLGRGVLPLPHPSPRNQGWFKHHPWFAEEVVPLLRRRVQALLRPTPARPPRPAPPPAGRR